MEPQQVVPDSCCADVAVEVGQEPGVITISEGSIKDQTIRGTVYLIEMSLKFRTYNCIRSKTSANSGIITNAAELAKERES